MKKKSVLEGKLLQNVSLFPEITCQLQNLQPNLETDLKKKSKRVKYSLVKDSS